MAKTFTDGFYKHSAWIKTRRKYLKMHPYCERCLEYGIIKPADIVHHKHYIDEQNINDANVTLNLDNLEALCQDCHNKEHHANSEVRDELMFDTDGNLIKR